MRPNFVRILFRTRVSPKSTKSGFGITVFDTIRDKVHVMYMHAVSFLVRQIFVSEINVHGTSNCPNSNLSPPPNYSKFRVWSSLKVDHNRNSNHFMITWPQTCSVFQKSISNESMILTVSISPNVKTAIIRNILLTPRMQSKSCFNEISAENP